MNLIIQVKKEIADEKEKQKEADEKIPILLDIPAAVRGVSIEPALEEIDLDGFLGTCQCSQPTLNDGITPSHEHWCPPVGLDWVIYGCESGPKRRPCDWEWARKVKDQCVEAGVPIFIKQLPRFGKVIKIPLLDGRVWNQLPEVK